MRQHFSRAAILILIVLLAVLLGRPYLDTLLFAATSPRPIAARSDLAEAERATIGLFERVSPSVVQVVGVAVRKQLGDDMAVQQCLQQNRTMLSSACQKVFQ
jgi:hypothetical protein